MIKNILWKGIAEESLEYCSISYKDMIKVRSSIVGCHETLPYNALYEIELDQHWIVRSVSLRSSIANMDHSISLKHQGYGKWQLDNKEWPQLEGCTDLDISITPFTNTLPINRLGRDLQHTAMIDVVYIDLLEFRIRKERQLYTRLDRNHYRFSNDTGDFTAEITVDDEGLVIDYPGLFERVLKRQ